MKNKSKKAVMVILDGLGDLETPKTPLQLAKKPNIDHMAKEGEVGLLSPLGKGVVPTSDKSHLVLFGYDLKKEYCGRGPMEAFGAGIKLKHGDVAFRANFATLKNNKIIDRRAGRISSALSKELSKLVPKKIEDVKIIFKSTVEHRGALVLRGKGLSANITPTDSHTLGSMPKCKSKDEKEDSKKTARIINKFTEIVYEKLDNSRLNKNRALPANTLLLRGAGEYKQVQTIEKRFGLKYACIAGGALYKGVAQYVGMDILKVNGATGDKNTNLKAKGNACITALKKYDFVFLHVKATDSFSHDGDCEGKTKIIERVDKELIPLLIKSEAFVVITGDHSTPCSIGDHSYHPVPILFYGDGKDSVDKFDERNCKKGKLGTILGKNLMKMIVKEIKKN